MQIKKYSLVDQIYNKLRADILNLSYPLGAKLSVAELQQQLKVSCTPIREAINRLQQEGLVTYTTNIGARIITLEPHDIEEIQQLALTLHHAAIRLAIANGKHNLLTAELQQCFTEYCNSTTEHQEVTAINHFIGVYYHNCGNRRLDSSMLSIQGQQLLLRYLYAGLCPERAHHQDYFQAMLNATQTGDAEAVCYHLSAYTALMTDTLKESLIPEEIPSDKD